MVILYVRKIFVVFFMGVRPLWVGDQYLLSEKFHFYDHKNNLLNSMGTTKNKHWEIEHRIRKNMIQILDFIFNETGQQHKARRGFPNRQGVWYFGHDVSPFWVWSLSSVNREQEFMAHGVIENIQQDNVWKNSTETDTWGYNILVNAVIY